MVVTETSSTRGGANLGGRHCFFLTVWGGAALLDWKIDEPIAEASG